LCCLSCCCVKYSKYKCHSIKIKKPGQSPVRLHTPPTTIISFVKGDYRRQQMEDKSSFDIWNIANDFGPFNLFLFLFFKFFIIIFCYFYELLMWRPAVLFFFLKKRSVSFLINRCRLYYTNCSGCFSFFTIKSKRPKRFQQNKNTFAHLSDEWLF
jgi:hypothetical protein